MKLKLQIRAFSSKSATYRTGISNDLVLSASMSWSSKQPKTHWEHFEAIKSKNLTDKFIDLNIYQDAKEIDPVFCMQML